MHEFLIMGPESWRDSMERFCQYKQDTGISSAVVTCEAAEAGPGVDAPDRIKRRIEHEHRVNGARLVLLVGDADRFPVRYIKATSTEWGTLWYASDLYYADLYDSSGAFDDWDADGDGIFAEMDFSKTASPSFNVDKINLYPDVVVGRVPASTLEEAERYFTKVRDYEYAARESAAYGFPTDWYRDALFVSGPGFGAVADLHAVPLASAGFRITKLKEDDPSWAGDSRQAQRHEKLRAALNNGAGVLYFRGHGNTNFMADWLTAQDVSLLENQQRLPIVVSMSCYTARFHVDQNEYLTTMGVSWTGGQDYFGDRPTPADLQPKHDKDSLAEEFLVRRNTGAIAFIGATHKFEHGGQALAGYLFEAYRDAPQPPTLGSLWHQALHRFVATDLKGGTIGMGPYYAFIHAHKVMLFGDPSLRLGGLAAPQWPSVPGHLRPELAQAALG